MVVRSSLRQGFILCLMLLSSCFGGGHYAPVIERKERAEVVPEVHVVTRGDTLYSIAWLYSMDFRGLARTNGVGAPYTIYPGQKIRLKPVVVTSKQQAQRPLANSANRPAKAQTRTSDTSRPAKVTVAKVDTPKNQQSAYPFRWAWPAPGKIVRPFTSATAVHKGIDIQGKFGEPVHAANSGTVVYAGSGLVGFGQLLIIKHNERYLSAYGHNNKLLVKEGELVKVGQKIAEFGDTGTDTVKLHFEIRRDGKPTNPLSLLPKAR